MAELRELIRKHEELGSNDLPIELRANFALPMEDDGHYQPMGAVNSAPVLMFGPELSGILRKTPDTFGYDGYVFIKRDVIEDPTGTYATVTYEEANYKLASLQRRAAFASERLAEIPQKKMHIPEGYEAYLKREIADSTKQVPILSRAILQHI